MNTQQETPAEENQPAPKMYNMRPCPCCGEYPIIGTYEMPPVDDVTMNTIGVVCMNDTCGLTIALIDVKGVNEDTRRDIVVARWNRRLEPSRILRL